MYFLNFYIYSIIKSLRCAHISTLNLQSSISQGILRIIGSSSFGRSPSKRLVHGVNQGPLVEEKGKVLLPPGRPPRPYDNKVQSLGSREPRQAWGEGNPSDELVYLYYFYFFSPLFFISCQILSNSSYFCVLFAISLPRTLTLVFFGPFKKKKQKRCLMTMTMSRTEQHSEGGFLSLRDEITGSHTQVCGGSAFSPVLGSRILSYVDDDSVIEKDIYDLPDYSEPTSSPAPQVGTLWRCVNFSRFFLAYPCPSGTPSIFFQIFFHLAFNLDLFFKFGRQMVDKF